MNTSHGRQTGQKRHQDDHHHSATNHGARPNHTLVNKPDPEHLTKVITNRKARLSRDHRSDHHAEGHVASTQAHSKGSRVSKHRVSGLDKI